MLNKIKEYLNETEVKEQTPSKKVTKKSETNDGITLSQSDKDDLLIDRNQMIQEAAYFRAEKRNFFGGDPAEDWLAAEAEIENSRNRLETSAGKQ